MKLTFTGLIYWFSLVVFGCAAFLCLYYLWRTLGRGESVTRTLRTADEEGRYWKLLPSWLWLGRFSPTAWVERHASKLRELLGILTLVALSRLLIILIADLTLMLFKNHSGNLAESLHWLWDKWDAGHFLQVARNGYQKTGEERFFIVFLPLYPFLIRCVAWVWRSYEGAGAAVANFSLLITGCYLYRLVRLDFNRKLARNSVIFLVFFPFSFFLGAVYSDSLFLALSVLTFYYLRRANWFAAGFFGFLAALTRNFGVLLLVPTVIEFLVTTDLFSKILLKEWAEVRKLVRDIWYVLGIPLGFGVYLLLNRIVTGDWFKFVVYQREHWSNGFGFFPANLANYLGYALNGKPCDRIALWIPELVALGLALGLLFYGFCRKIRLSYLVYMTLYLFTCASATWLISGTRYVMGLFPIYPLLALLTRKKYSAMLWVTVSAALLTFYLIAFVLDYYVM
jgi:hypothetical protein